MPTWALRATFSGHTLGVQALSYLNGTLLSGSFDWDIIAWNMERLEKIGTMVGHKAPVTAVSQVGRWVFQYGVCQVCDTWSTHQLLALVVDVAARCSASCPHASMSGRWSVGAPLGARVYHGPFLMCSCYMRQFAHPSPILLSSSVHCSRPLPLIEE